MEALLQGALRTFQNLSRESSVLVGRMSEFIEPWHIGLFVFGIWLLVKITRPGVGRG